MGGATTSSLGETSRSSRSRFRRSPKFPVAMDRPCPAEPARPKRGRREVASAAADGGAHSRKVWAPLDGTIGGGAERGKKNAGGGLRGGRTLTPPPPPTSPKTILRKLTSNLSIFIS